MGEGGGQKKRPRGCKRNGRMTRGGEGQRKRNDWPRRKFSLGETSGRA